MNSTEKQPAKRTILIVDDQPEISSFLGDYFEADKSIAELVDIKVACTGADGLRELKEGKIAALVTDGSIDHNGTDGITLARAALEQGVPKDLIYIYTSAPADYTQEANKLGVKVLMKREHSALRGYLNFHLTR